MNVHPRPNSPNAASPASHGAALESGAGSFVATTMSSRSWTIGGAVVRGARGPRASLNQLGCHSQITCASPF